MVIVGSTTAAHAATTQPALIDQRHPVTLMNHHPESNPLFSLAVDKSYAYAD
jgi:hypothetical protein